MARDRRQYPRSVVNSPVIVSLGRSKAGLLFDLGEGGLSVHGLVPQSQDEFTHVAFDLAQGDGFIEATVGITWTSDSENRTGMRFVQVGDKSQQQIREWIGVRTGTVATRSAVLESDVPEPAAISRASDLSAFSIPQNNVAPFPPQTGRESALFEPAMTANVGLSRHSKSRHRLSLFLAATLLFLALVLLGYYLLGIVEKSKVSKIKFASETRQVPSKGVIRAANSSPARVRPALPSGVSVDQPGWVLQVGAMKYEEHADALAAALNQRNFPAFVFRRNGDRFYRVAVGPYRDLDSSTKVKDELGKQNFKAILRQWSPE